MKSVFTTLKVLLEDLNSELSHIKMLQVNLALHLSELERQVSVNSCVHDVFDI